MDKVLILKGASNKGKTSTLKILIEELKRAHAGTIQHQQPCGNDVFVVLKIPKLGNVGIITFGDKGYEQQVHNALSQCLGLGCVAVVGASHMRYTKKPESIYKILWDFGNHQQAKTVETTTLIKDDDFGCILQSKDVNIICAKYLIDILLNL